MDMLPELASTLRSPEDTLLVKEKVEAVLRAVSRLGKRDREIVAMRMGAGINNREIAGILHMKEGTVAVCLFRAIRRIRLQLREDGR
jgi:RNA polymerase sigma-70 factor (ECF subfamily)